MSGTAVPGQQQQVAQHGVEKDKHDDSGELTPERQDSKVENVQGVKEGEILSKKFLFHHNASSTFSYFYVSKCSDLKNLGLLST